MNFQRSSGILLHPTSLPGPYGIGDLGPFAYRFVDWLASSGCKLWQFLPLGPTGFGDSPYQCFSAFAGNPYLISPDELITDGFLTQPDLTDKPDFSDAFVDFGLLIPWKLSLLERAFRGFQLQPASAREDFNFFSADNAAWLENYSIFMAIKEAQGGSAWTDWPEPLRTRDARAITKVQKDYAESILRFSFYQYLFFKQWKALRAFARERGVQLIGDLPIFVACDSVDLWSNPELFFLDESGRPTFVAGVPPDQFSATGQLWGNPLFNWQVHKQKGYGWWLARLRSTLQMVDILRLDHFRGFAGYYEIPAEHETAEFGRWVPGPGADLFRKVDENLGDGLISPGTGLPLIAEDLGVITTDVIELRDGFQLPGMKVLQFGFTSPDNPFLPHNYIPNCVAYTGTHDNDTAQGWLTSVPREKREFALRYLRSDGHDFAWDLINSVWSSVAVFAITPMQDVLSLGGQARMNYPSRLGGNWRWRMQEEDMSEETAERLYKLNNIYNR
jgi:4-alpha-glucanotransferase